jgi:isopenicillin-N N-acyltransferase-like protein
MIATHTSRPAAPFDRGADFGRRHEHAVRGTASFYERLFADVHSLTRQEVDLLGEEVLENLDAHAPDLASEIEGIAEGSAVPAARIAAMNARTEILAGARPTECSVVGVDHTRSSTGLPVLAQNWDWHPDVSPNLVLWTVQSEGGSFTTLTEAGILAKIGRNDRGVAVCLNIMTSGVDGGVGGTPVHIALRLVLERSKTMSEAAVLIESLRFSASSALSVASTGHGGEAPGLATFEVSPAGTRRVDPSDGLLLHTNHFLEPHVSVVDTYRRDWPDTLARLSDLRETLAPQALITPASIKGVLASHRAGVIAVCCHDPENPSYVDRQATLASVYMSLDNPTIEFTQGNPCQAEYLSTSVVGLRPVLPRRQRR